MFWALLLSFIELKENQHAIRDQIRPYISYRYHSHYDRNEGKKKGSNYKEKHVQIGSLRNQELTLAPRFSDLRGDHGREALPGVRAQLMLEDKPGEDFRSTQNRANKYVTPTLPLQGRLGEDD